MVIYFKVANSNLVVGLMKGPSTQLGGVLSPSLQQLKSSCFGTCALNMASNQSRLLAHQRVTT